MTHAAPATGPIAEEDVERAPVPECPLWTSPGAAAAAFQAGPSGLGTSAARITTQFARDPGYAEMQWGDGTASPLYCPVVERVDDALAEEVDRRLAVWAGECGFTGDGLDQITGAGFGRLAMLAHPDTD